MQFIYVQYLGCAYHYVRIRPKTIKDVRNFYDTMLLSAASSTFEEMKPPPPKMQSTKVVSEATGTKKPKQVCSYCQRLSEGHYLRSYKKVDGAWKPTGIVCRYFHGEQAYAAAAAAKRKREEEAAAKKAAAKRARKIQQKNTKH
eukprot:SAG31_NODE_17628_length_663_cov_2.297872_1_plen_144_part_00